MDDWKKKVEEHLERKREIEEDRSKNEFKKLLAKYKSRFFCYICGRQSERPSFITDDNDNRFPNWNFPGDLHKCTICQRWTCGEHIYKGICHKCAERL